MIDIRDAAEAYSAAVFGPMPLMANCCKENPAFSWRNHDYFRRTRRIITTTRADEKVRAEILADARSRLASIASTIAEIDPVAAHVFILMIRNVYLERWKYIVSGQTLTQLTGQV